MTADGGYQRSGTRVRSCRTRQRIRYSLLPEQSPNSENSPTCQSHRIQQMRDVENDNDSKPIYLDWTPMSTDLQHVRLLTSAITLGGMTADGYQRSGTRVRSCCTRQRIRNTLLLEHLRNSENSPTCQSHRIQQMLHVENDNDSVPIYLDWTSMSTDLQHVRL